MHIRLINGLLLPCLVAAALAGCGGGSSDDSSGASSSGGTSSGASSSGGTSSGGTSSGASSSGGTSSGASSSGGTSSGGTSSGGTSSGSSSGGSSGTAAVGATISGLTGTGLVLELSGSSLTAPEDVPVTAGTTTASFTTVLPAAATYTVTVKTQPKFPTQACAVGSDGSGTAADTAITATVTCTTTVGRYVYTSNNGGGANSVSTFAIGAGGVLTAVGAPVATGTSPYGMVLDRARGHLYVADEVSNDIYGYSIDQTSGALTPLATEPAAATGSQPEALIMDASGKFLYAANLSSGNISGYSVGSDGTLTSLGAMLPVGTLASPLALASAPKAEVIYVANQGNASFGGSVTAYGVDATTGALTLVADYPTAIALTTVGTDGPTGLTVDPTGKYLYMGNMDSSSATQPSVTLGYSIDSTTGALTPLTGSPFAIASTRQMAVDPSGTYLFTAVATAVPAQSAIAVSSIGADGSLTAAGTLYDTPAGSAGPFGVAVDPSGQFVYASDSYTNDVLGYTLDSTGVLSTVGPAVSTVAANPDWIVID